MSKLSNLKEKISEMNTTLEDETNGVHYMFELECKKFKELADSINTEILEIDTEKLKTEHGYLQSQINSIKTHLLKNDEDDQKNNPTGNEENVFEIQTIELQVKNIDNHNYITDCTIDVHSPTSFEITGEYSKDVQSDRPSA